MYLGLRYIESYGMLSLRVVVLVDGKNTLHLSVGVPDVEG